MGFLPLAFSGSSVQVGEGSELLCRRELSHSGARGVGGRLLCGLVSAFVSFYPLMAGNPVVFYPYTKCKYLLFGLDNSRDKPLSGSRRVCSHARQSSLCIGEDPYCRWLWSWA